MRTQVIDWSTALHGEKHPLPLQLIFLGKHLDRLLERRLGEQGLNRTQAMVLVALNRRPGLKAQDLCPHARVEPANVTRTVQSLERLGLLERRAHPTDGRASLLYLTVKGSKAAVELAIDLDKLSVDLLRDVDQREIDHLQRSLSLLRRAVSSQLSAASDQHSAHCYDDASDSLPDGRTTDRRPIRTNSSSRETAAFDPPEADR